MRGEQGAGEVQVAGPVTAELGWEREDQVERAVLDPGAAKCPHRRADARRVVRAMHPAQHAVVERLGAERDPVDAGGTPGGSVLRGHVLRICLERHLGSAECGMRNAEFLDRKSTRLNSSHVRISYAVFCLKKKKTQILSNASWSCTDSCKSLLHVAALFCARRD